jgi:FkbM family methyltransferase
LDWRVVAPGGRYVGFEPNPLAVRFVEGRIRANSLNACEVHLRAAGRSPGTAMLYRRPWLRYDTAASLDAALRPGRRTEAQPVSVVALDDVLLGAASPIGIVKVDVEGWELDVLTGAYSVLSELRPFVVCEVLYRDRAADESRYRERLKSLNNLLREVRYRVMSVDKRSNALTPVQALPAGTWSWSNRAACDYVFVPEERGWSRAPVSLSNPRDWPSWGVVGP